MQAEFSNASQNQLKKWARLADAKFRHEDSLFLAEGVKVVEELLKSDWPVEAILVLPEKIQYWQERIDHKKDKFPVYQLTRSEWKKLSQDKEPEGIMTVARIKPEPSLSDLIDATYGNILILHEINNPGNIGALMRSALWFGFARIIISANSVDYTNPKAIRASMGSLFHLTVVSNIDLAAALTEVRKTHRLVGSDVNQGTLPHPLVNKVALLLGNESHGLPENILALTDERWCIKGNAQADSLSLPQAAAILMYEISKKG